MGDERWVAPGWSAVSQNDTVGGASGINALQVTPPMLISRFEVKKKKKKFSQWNGAPIHNNVEQISKAEKLVCGKAFSGEIFCFPSFWEKKL